jgi:3-methyladenine DNA glycosylase AlkD
MRAYFKRDVTVTFYGVTVPEIRRLARATWQTHRHEWSVGDAIAFCDVLIRDAELEAKGVGVLTLGRWRTELPRGLFRKARGWLGAGHCASWAAVDLVAPELVTPLIDRFGDLRAELVRWTRARSLWVRRAAPVALVPCARHGRWLGTCYGVARALLDDDEDLIHKAVGWMLREAGKTDAERLERFLLRHGERIPRTTLRYAIERFPETRRRSLLTSTRRRAGLA